VKVVRVLSIVLGAVLLIAGIAVAAYVGPDDEVDLGAHRVGPPEAPMIATQPDFFSLRDATVVVRARSAGGVFVGAAPDREVTDYTKGVRHYALNDFSTSGELGGTVVKGDAQQPDPTKATFWSEQAHGSGEQRIQMSLTDSPSGFVVQATKPGPGTTIGVGIKLSGLFLLAVVVALVGLVLIVLPVLLGRRARRRRTTLAEESGAAAPRAVLFALVAGLLAVLLGGCFAIPKKADSGTAGAAPALADPAAAAALQKDYDTRNNAAIRAASNAPYDAKAWAGADTGPLLEVDSFDTGLAKAKKSTSKPLVHGAPSRAYVPAASTYPLYAMVASDVRSGEAKPAPSVVGLAVFTRDRAVAPWLAQASLGVKRAQLPKALAYGAASTPTKAQVARATTVAGSLVDYYTSGKKPDYTVTKALNAPVVLAKKQFGANSAQVARSAVTARLYGDATTSVRVVRVKGGVLAIASYVADVVVTPKPGLMLAFSGIEGQIRGTTPVARLSQQGVATAAWMVPDSGKPTVLGGSWSEALR
jgi:hypothetical protein